MSFFTAEPSIVGYLSCENSLIGTLTISTAPVPHDPYTGSYQIIPDADADQVLDTSNKLLVDDIIVYQIPYSEVENNAGGLTVTIV